LNFETYVSDAWTKIKTVGNILDHTNYHLYCNTFVTCWYQISHFANL